MFSLTRVGKITRENRLYPQPTCSCPKSNISTFIYPCCEKLGFLGLAPWNTCQAKTKAPVIITFSFRLLWNSNFHRKPFQSGKKLLSAVLSMGLLLCLVIQYSYSLFVLVLYIFQCLLKQKTSLFPFGIAEL